LLDAGGYRALRTDIRQADEREYVDENRRGDHIWWISDLSRFQEHYPEWKLEYNVPAKSCRKFLK